nr:hypothetical protein [Microbacterium bovistercoris]
MTAKHRDPEYRRNATTVRRQVALGVRARVCWRCGRPIEQGEVWDVGHRDPYSPPSLGNLAPEHRSRRAGCVGNRAAGGRIGAAITNSRHGTTTTATPRPPRQTGGAPLPWG